MDDNDDDKVIGLDLNHPSPSSPPPDIEDRIRQLEAVTARANQRQRWRRITNNPEVNYAPVIESTNANNRKRDISQLAKALEMDDLLDDSNKKLDNKKLDNGGCDGNFFDCNICLDVAKDPILTCCGHLFCWGCFYRVPYVDSVSKECPACKGEVIDSNVTPIYGNGKGSSLEVSGSGSGVKIPPRPRARRVEGVRQRGFVTGVSHVPVADALRRMILGLGLVDGSSHPPGVIGLIPTPAVSQMLLNGSEGGILTGAANMRLLNGSEGGVLTPVANLRLLNGSEGGIPIGAANLRLLHGSEGGVLTHVANLRLLNGSEGGIPTHVPANLRLLNGSEGGIPTLAANLRLLNGSEGGIPSPAANPWLLNGSVGGIPTHAANPQLLNDSEGRILTPVANLRLLNGSEGGIPTPAANPWLLNGSEGGIPTHVPANPQLLSGSEDGIPTLAANLRLLNGSEGGIPIPVPANPQLLNGSEGRGFSGVVSERLVEDLETYISVADTTVDIQSEAQVAEMNLSRRSLGTTVLHMGALDNDGSVEMDLTISRRASSRRRGVLDLEGQSSLELRRR